MTAYAKINAAFASASEGMDDILAGVLHRVAHGQIVDGLMNVAALPEDRRRAVFSEFVSNTGLGTPPTKAQR